MTRLAIEAVFWASVCWFAYVYALYPALLMLACALVQLRHDWHFVSRRPDRRAHELTLEELPAVSLVMPIHNEAGVLLEKLDNLRGLDYPRERLEIILVSDGSDDGSNEILQERARDCRLVLRPRCEGKAAALNEGVAQARHELLVLCDAATLIEPDAIRKLVRHFRRPRVGAVCGTLHFCSCGESAHTEGVYWRYESVLRLMEGRLGATLGASGPLYALRRECFPQLDPTTLIDDLLVPMHVRALGYGVAYDPEARAVDVPAADIEGEFARRRRLAVGSFRALGALLRVPLPAVTRWAFLSHKVGRWLLPFFLLSLLGASVALVALRPMALSVYAAALALQVAFYFWALAGLALRRYQMQVRSASFAYYLLAMNAAFLVGLMMLLFRQGNVPWRRAA